jgi:hypothetical protein
MSGVVQLELKQTKQKRERGRRERRYVLEGEN